MIQEESVGNTILDQGFVCSVDYGAFTSSQDYCNHMSELSEMSYFMCRIYKFHENENAFYKSECCYCSNAVIL